MLVSNVGQGQWATLITSEYCLHFDMGGEFKPSQEMLRVCQSIPNTISLSHYDWDHISWISKSISWFDQICIESETIQETKSKKKNIIKKLPPCRSQIGTKPQKWQYQQVFFNTKAKSSNAQSQVYIAANKVLIPGDSPQSEEKKWIKNLLQPENITVLILGHHGSRTSTSQELLDHLPNLNMAIASARFSRYKHPHNEVINKLKIKKTPVLKTEDWGHIFIQL